MEICYFVGIGVVERLCCGWSRLILAKTANSYKFCVIFTPEDNRKEQLKKCVWIKISNFDVLHRKCDDNIEIPCQFCCNHACHAAAAVIHRRFFAPSQCHTHYGHINRPPFLRATAVPCLAGMTVNATVDCLLLVCVNLCRFPLD